MTHTTIPTFKSIILTHIVLCLLATITIGIFYTLRLQSIGIPDNFENGLLLELAIPLYAIISYAAAYFIGKSKLKKLKKADSLSTKLEVYKKWNLMQWAAIEGSILFACLGFYLSGRNNLLLYALMLGVMLLYFRPLKARAVELLDLQPEEANQLFENA